MLSSNTSAVSGDATYIEDVFSTYLYTGNDSTQNIVNGIDLSTKGGMVWLKGRSLAVGHYLYDTVRGIANGPLSSENTNAAYTANTPKTLTSFNTNGFSMQDDSASFGANVSPRTQVSWTFREQSKFFDVVTYTGTGVARTVAHSLGSIPGCIIVKRTDAAASWFVYHRSLGATKRLTLEGTGAASAVSSTWNNTDPTSTEFTVGTGSTNTSGGTYVAYIFAHDAGGFGLTGTDNVISCGSFTPDGSGNATIDLGWEPQWLLRKTYNDVGDWEIRDSMRGFSMSSSALLYPNYSLAETTGAAATFIPTATGFKYVNGGTQPMIYIAIRRGPMKVPTDATKVFAPVTYSGTSSATTINTGFPVDLTTSHTRNAAATNAFVDRLRGNGTILQTQATTAESNSSLYFGVNGTQEGTDFPSSSFNTSGTNYINYAFRRAPGFFDEVCYTGTGSATTFSHNLGVVPELMIVKRRDGLNGWYLYSSSFANTETILLNTTAAKTTSTTLWDSTTPTSSVFSVGTSTASNASAGTYITYLFATCPGVSKVGSYTGTGTTQQIDCGFAAGARFVLVKRTDSTGDWYTWDTARGIVAGNDPYKLLNSTAAEVTITDYIDTYSAGFELSTTAAATVNVIGGSYIFLAIA